MKPVFLAALAFLLAGCSSLETKQAGDYTQLRRIYVEHRLTDTHRIDELIVADLKARGYDASCGYLTMMPENTEAIVTYTDRWQWDFKSYLIDLEIEMRANFTGKALARGSYHQASASTKPPEEVVKLILDPLFPKR